MELYLHLPFCVRKCRYCDFASWAGAEDRMADYLSQMAREAERRADELGPQPAETVFIGGGTPSVVSADLLTGLLCRVFSFFTPIRGAEFTAEANPGTLTPAWLEAMRSAGCNRLSMGLQASQPALLRTLGRIHSAEDAAVSVRMARAAGFRNISLDLIFGIPGQTPDIWRDTLAFALSLEPEHLSCYGLIPEEGTPLKRDLDEGRLTLPPEDDERRMYDLAIETLARAGYAQYEISNFARPGFECRHNIGYWTRVPYLGLGLSAASLLPADGGTWRRETNPADWEGYSSVVNGDAPRDTETVDRADAQFETMMLGLRMNRGVREDEYMAAYGEPVTARWGFRLESLRGRGLLDHADGCWRLTRRGMDIQNSILVELMD